MARGRCSGCGYEDASAPKVARHVAGCSEYAALYRTDPESCLTPIAEAERYAREQASAEEQDRRAEAKSQAVDRWREFQELRAERDRLRWSSSTRAADGKGRPLTHVEMRELDGAEAGGQDVAAALAELDSGDISPRRRVVLGAYAALI